MEEEPLVKFLSDVTQGLRKGWTAHVSRANNRLHYMNHDTKTSSWLPPVESWNPGGTGLPYGWELARDKDGKIYYINHVNKTSTYEDPRRKDATDEEPPEPRDVELLRDPQMGFGFVAGSEKPVIVRFVTEGGPSEGKLQPGDQILRINSENVEKAPREHVIELVRSCKQSVKLTVCQPYNLNGARKSALLSAAKKAKLKSKPSRVRFAEGVVINGSPLYSPSPFESCVPFLPNVLKVFLENGQTKSFKYDSTTTIQDVLDSLREKLSVKCVEHFSLVVEHIKSIRRNKLTLLDPRDTLAKIAARPGAHHLRCLFRVVFVPKDAYDLLQKDPVAFEYLYVQCCNDVVHERFAPELKYDIALRLAALHMQQHALSSGLQGKINIKAIERECGLDRFVPLSLLETMKRKELRKLLAHFLKQNQSLSAPGQKQLTALQAKLHYLKIISELPSYGAKCFSTNLKDSTMETALLVSPKYGISQINSLRSTVTPMTLAHIEEASSVHVSKDDELSYGVELFLKNPDRDSFVFSLEDRDTEEFVLLLRGYHRLLAGRDLPVHWKVIDPWRIVSVSPNYHGQHEVHLAPWNYSPKFDGTDETSSPTRMIDLALPVPPYTPCDSVLLRSGSRETFSQSTLSLPNLVDHNMNETQRTATLPSSHRSGPSFITSYAHLQPPPAAHPPVPTAVTTNPSTGQEDVNQANEGIDMHSVMSIEMLEDADGDGELFEAKNREVIQRVVEMNQIVSDAEDYLQDDQEVPADEDVDGKLHPNTECINPVKLEGTSALRAADSLLLLTQIENYPDDSVEALVEGTKNIDPDASPSESDTDSLSTPNDSPLHSARIKDSPQLRTRNRTGSSFGLHSPDLLPGVDCEGQDVMEILKQLQTSNELSLPFAEGTFYLDPDIIDLTMIPPPITPDSDVPLTNTGTPLDNPPLSFVDPKLAKGEISSSKPKKEAESCKTDTGRVVAELDNLCHALSELRAKNVSSQQEMFGEEPPLTLNSLPPIDDIDSFIASVTVPPPPVSLYENQFSEYGPGEGQEDDLSAFIIPPPPSSSPSTEEQNEVIARFERAAADMKRMMGDVNSPNRTARHSSMSVTVEEPDKDAGFVAHNSWSGVTSTVLGSRSTACNGSTNSNGHQSQFFPSTPAYDSMKINTNGFSNGDTLSLASDCDFHGSVGGDSSGYETLTSSLTSYGEMAFPEENEDDEIFYQDPRSYVNTEFCFDGPKYANVMVRGGGPMAILAQDDNEYEEVAFRFDSSPILTNGHSVSNGYRDEHPRAPPRLRKFTDHKGSSDDIGIGLDLTSHESISPRMNRSVSWASLPEPGTPSPGNPRRLKPLINGKSPKPPLPPASPNADRARKALKAGFALNSRLQPTIPPSVGRNVTNGSNGFTNGSPRGLTNGNNCPVDDSTNNNVDEDAVNESYLVVSNGDDGTILTNGHFHVNGIIERKMDSKFDPNLIEEVEDDKMENELELTNGDLERHERFSDVLKGIKGMVFHLDVVSQNWLKNKESNGLNGQVTTSDQEKFATAKEALIAESRQFVTASKLFVKSATESSDKVTDHLTTCVTLLGRIFAVSELVLMRMSSLLQVTSLVEKLKEVALAYSNTLVAAQQTVGKHATNPDMCSLMHQATALATALTTLMRTLRTFSTP